MVYAMIIVLVYVVPCFLNFFGSFDGTFRTDFRTAAALQAMGSIVIFESFRGFRPGRRVLSDRLYRIC
jgi:hypothetical protein